MAEQQNPVFKEYVPTPVEGLNEWELKRKKERQVASFNDKMNLLADKIIEMTEKRGQDDDLVVILTSFLDIAMEMQAMMDTLNAVDVAVDCLTDAISFLDSAVEFNRQLVSTSLDQNYGFFARMKEKRRMKKALKNNINRMVTVVHGLEMKYRMMMDMMNSFKKVGVKLKSMAAQTKNPKKSAKAAPQNNERVQNFLFQRREQLSGNDTGAAAPKPGASAGSAPASDFSDIL